MTQTTTDEIARAAGVSPRTFFRYFPTKESVLFFGEYDFINAVSGVYLAQPDELSDFEAMANSFALLAPGLKRIRKRIAQYHEAVASSLVLLGRERKNHEANAETVAKVIAERRRLASPDERMPPAGGSRNAAGRARPQSVVVDPESRAGRPDSAGVRRAAIGVEVVGPRVVEPGAVRAGPRRVRSADTACADKSDRFRSARRRSRRGSRAGRTRRSPPRAGNR